MKGTRRMVVVALTLGALLVSACSDDDVKADARTPDAGLADGAPDLHLDAAADSLTDAPKGRPTVGTWKVTSLTCDGKSQTIPELVLTIDGPEGTSGTFVQTFDPNCVVTITETYSYDPPFTITPTGVVCNPNGACNTIAAFAGKDCLPLPPSTRFDLLLKGDVMNLGRTATGPEDLPCDIGEFVDFTLQRQP